MSVVPRSEQFDDVYFSVADGLAETRHVFLDGNGLPEAWAGRDQFTICETGFGTGLNFLAVYKLWRAAGGCAARLDYISFEKFPVSGAYIAEVLGHWRDDIGEELDLLVARYLDKIGSGTIRFVMPGNVFVTLVFDDVNVALPKLNAQVNCWFLDGFKPSSNPEMWSETVFQNMGRLSRDGTTFATFTSAGFVRRGLVAARFDVQKVPGYGHKREMSIGKYVGGNP